MIADEIDLVTVGCSVWDQPSHADPELPIRGGIVWAVDRAADPDTGEIGLLFHCAEIHHRGKRHVRLVELPSAVVAQWNLPNTASIRSLVTQCHRQIAEAGKARGSDELRLLDVINQLTAVL